MSDPTASPDKSTPSSATASSGVTPPETEPNVPESAPAHGTPDAAPAADLTDATATPEAPGPAAIGDTAGTGTIIALGCITGTVFLIILGVIYLIVTRLLG